MPLEGLWTPDAAQEPRERFRLCVTCGAKYPMSQRSQWERHVVRCADKNEEVILEHVAAQESSIYTAIGDKERFAHLRKRAAKKALRGG